MQVDRRAGVTSGAEIIERIRDKGIVIVDQALVARAGPIDLRHTHARVVVASIQTYLNVPVLRDPKAHKGS